MSLYELLLEINPTTLSLVGWDSVVSIATHYKLYILGIKSRCGHVKWLGSGVEHPTPSSVKVKARTELYLYSPLGLHGRLQGEIYLSYIPL
jgi:hypothetical protein